MRGPRGRLGPAAGRGAHLGGQLPVPVEPGLGRQPAGQYPAEGGGVPGAVRARVRGDEAVQRLPGGGRGLPAQRPARQAVRLREPRVQDGRAPGPADRVGLGLGGPGRAFTGRPGQDAWSRAKASTCAGPGSSGGGTTAASRNAATARAGIRAGSQARQNRARERCSAGRSPCRSGGAGRPVRRAGTPA
ncbi:hypothetical protein SCALM49S_09604 [Streptomyces californicus]